MRPHDSRLTRIAKWGDDWDVDEESRPDSPRSRTINPYPQERDLRDFLAVVLKRKLLILSLVLMTTTAATIYVFSLPLKYEARATLRVQPRTFSFLENGRGVVFQSSDNYDYLNTQVVLLSNPQLIRQVVARLNLQDNPGFLEGLRHAGFASSLGRLFSRGKAAPPPREIEPVAETADDPGSTGTFTVEQTLRMEPYVNLILSNLKVEQEKYTNLITIRFTHTNPELAMKVAETIADLFVSQDSSYETAGTRKAMETLAKQIAVLETEINGTEEKRLGYLKTHNLPLADGKGRNLTTERVGTLSEQLLAAEDDRKNLEAAYQTAMRTKNIFLIPQIRDSNDVQEIQKSLRELEQRRASLAEIYTPEWPEVKKIDSELRKVRGQLEDEAWQALLALNTNLSVAVARESKLRAAYNEEQGIANTQSRDEIELTNLNQRLETSKQIHSMLLQRQKEVELNALNRSDTVMIVTRPSVPTVPVDVERWRTIIISFALSLLAGIGVAYLIDFLDTKLHSVEDIAKHAQLASLAVIPSFRNTYRSAPWRFIFQNGKREHAPLALTEDLRSPTAEAYRQLRTSILLSTAGRAPKTLLVTSSLPGEGKTTTAVNVSAGLALLKQKRVLLVDFDPQGNASLALGVDIEHVRYSVTDLLTGALPDVQALGWEKGDNLHILPANATLKDVELELVRSVDGRWRLKQTLQPILDAFDFILIDTAGIRRKTKVHEDLEFYSVIRAIKAMDEADVCLLLLDASKGITAQDLNIFSLAVKKGKGVVVLVNKWDLVAKETNTAKIDEKELNERLSPVVDLPIIFISVTEKTRIFKAIEAALEVYENRQRKIPTAELNDVMLKAVEAYHPPVVRGHPLKIKYITQLHTQVPSFAFFCNFPDDIKQPYKNYIKGIADHRKNW